MNLKKLAKAISHLNYVVQRNWDFLPESMIVGNHDDLDLFVSDEDRAELELLIKGYEKIDCRSPQDNYYPQEISEELLSDRIKFNDFWIPNNYAHFFSLFYHNAVHKKDNPYGEKLKELFLEEFPPVRCTDGGVGYYV